MKARPVVLAKIVDGADIGMIQGRSSTSFAAKPLQSLGVVGNLIGKEFEGNGAAKVGVLGPVDDTHPATAELVDDAVMRDRLADHRGAILGRVPRQVKRGGNGHGFHG